MALSFQELADSLADNGGGVVRLDLLDVSVGLPVKLGDALSGTIAALRVHPLHLPRELCGVTVAVV